MQNKNTPILHAIDKQNVTLVKLLIDADSLVTIAGEKIPQVSEAVLKRAFETNDPQITLLFCEVNTVTLN